MLLLSSIISLLGIPRLIKNLFMAEDSASTFSLNTFPPETTIGFFTFFHILNAV
nr:hypothetical protein [Desulfurobacterium thermolithotrophum]